MAVIFLFSGIYYQRKPDVHSCKNHLFEYFVPYLRSVFSITKLSTWLPVPNKFAAMLCDANNICIFVLSAQSRVCDFKTSIQAVVHRWMMTDVDCFCVVLHYTS